MVTRGININRSEIGVDRLLRPVQIAMDVSEMEVKSRCVRVDPDGFSNQFDGSVVIAELIGHNSE